MYALSSAAVTMNTTSEHCLFKKIHVEIMHAKQIQSKNYSIFILNIITRRTVLAGRRNSTVTVCLSYQTVCTMSL